MEERQEKIDIFNPAFIFAFIAAGISDFAFLFLIALAVPFVGLVIAVFVVVAHYFAGFLVAFLVFPKITKGSLLSNIAGTATLDVGSALLLVAKIILALAIILPLPLLAIGIIIAIILANKFVELVANIILTIAVPEAKAAQAVGAAAKAAKAGKAVATGARAAEAGAGAAGAAAKGGTAAAGAEAAKTGEEVAAKGGEAATVGKAEQKAERMPWEKPEALEELKEKLLEPRGGELGEGEREEDEDLPLAA